MPECNLRTEIWSITAFDGFFFRKPFPSNSVKVEVSG